MPHTVPSIRPGTIAGTLVSSPQALITRSRMFVYSADQIVEKDLDELLTQRYVLKENEVVWISVVGLQDIDLIKRIGNFFQLHPLTLEDVVSSHQRPKIDVYDDYEFIVCKMVQFEQVLARQQLSIFLGNNFIISFLDAPSNLLTITEQNLFNLHSNISKRSVDHLAYQLMDFVIDSYFTVLGNYSEALDDFETQVIKGDAVNFIQKLHQMKSDLRLLKQYVWSHRDLFNVILRNEHNIIKPEEVIYFKDCYDHTIQQMDILESQRDMATSLLDIYLSTIANRLNQIMKILTIISIAFMPPSFLATVWGMNFVNMHELHWPYGYLLAWLVMFLAGALPCVVFWRSGWLRNN